MLLIVVTLINAFLPTCLSLCGRRFQVRVYATTSTVLYEFDVEFVSSNSHSHISPEYFVCFDFSVWVSPVSVWVSIII